MNVKTVTSIAQLHEKYLETWASNEKNAIFEISTTNSVELCLFHIVSTTFLLGLIFECSSRSELFIKGNELHQNNYFKKKFFSLFWVTIAPINVLISQR